MIYFNQIEDSGFFVYNYNATQRVGSLTASSIYPKGGIFIGDKMIPYKHQCSICGVVFFSKTRSHHICSKKCRGAACKSDKLKTSCEVCGWYLSLDLHHEKGKEYILCPNHHALLTRGICNIEELFNGNEIANKKTIENQEKRDLLLRLKYKKDLQAQKQQNQHSQLYEQIVALNLGKFTYKNLVNYTNYSYSVIKKRILEYIRNGKVERITGGGGKFQQAEFQLKKNV